MNAWSPLSMTFSPGGHSLVEPTQARPRAKRIDRAARAAAGIRRIVACLDGSDFGRGVVPHARAVARALGSELTLLSVLEPKASGDPKATPEDPLDWGLRRRAARVHLDGIANDPGGSGLEIRSELVHGRAAEQIFCFVEQHDIDLTAFCSHGIRGRTEFGLASTARKLIERSPGSLLLVPADAAAKTERPDYQRILVPLDGSTRGESVLPIAQRIAAAEGAELVLVHIVADPDVLSLGPPDGEGIELERRLVAHNERVARAYLERIRARLRQDGAAVSVRIVREGNVCTRLEELIRAEAADFVVMSAHGATARPDTPVGSVTEHALAHTAVPLLVLRERKRCAGEGRVRDRSRTRGEVTRSAVE